MPTEQIYQALILGLLVNVAPGFEVCSNRESVYGQYDVMILPKSAGQPGVVLELKMLDERRRETPKWHCKRRSGRSGRGDYAAELRARWGGRSRSTRWGSCWRGKRVWVEKGAG